MITSNDSPELSLKLKSYTATHNAYFLDDSSLQSNLNAAAFRKPTDVIFENGDKKLRMFENQGPFNIIHNQDFEDLTPYFNQDNSQIKVENHLSATLQENDQKWYEFQLLNYTLHTGNGDEVKIKIEINQVSQSSTHT